MLSFPSFPGPHNRECQPPRRFFVTREDACGKPYFRGRSLRYSMRVISSLFLKLLMIAAAFALCTLHLEAQLTLGGITGEVADPSGSVIPNATVTVVDEQT